MDELTQFYLNQAGSGNGGGESHEYIGPVYRAGFTRGQRGRGILGSFLRGVWSFVSPLFRSGAQALGKEALNTGASILTDAAASRGAVADLRNITQQRLTEGRDRLVSKMKGQGMGRARRGKSQPHRIAAGVPMKGSGRKRAVRRRVIAARRSRGRRLKEDIFGGYK